VDDATHRIYSRTEQHNSSIRAETVPGGPDAFEKNQVEAVQSAVSFVVEAKMKSIDSAIADQQNCPPTPSSLRLPRGAGRRAERPSAGSRHEPMERAHRAIIVGFPRKMTQGCLQRAAELFVEAAVPQERVHPAVRAFDTIEKIALDLSDPLKATDSLNVLISKPPLIFPDPIYPQQLITFCARRDLEPGARLLSLAMRKIRGALSAAVRPLDKEMGSDGLGGGICTIRHAEVPVLACHREFDKSGGPDSLVFVKLLFEKFPEVYAVISHVVERLEEEVVKLHNVFKHQEECGPQATGATAGITCLGDVSAAGFRILAVQSCSSFACRKLLGDVPHPSLSLPSGAGPSALSGLDSFLLSLMFRSGPSHLSLSSRRTVGSWNIRTLLAAVQPASAKASPRETRFLKLAKQLHVFFVHEAHGQLLEISELRRELRHYNIGHSVFSPSTCEGGVVTCIQPGLVKPFFKFHNS